MPVTYPAAVPTSGVTSIQWTNMTSSLVSRSPFTFQGQAQSYGGSIRLATISVDGLNRDSAEDWIGFLESLQGTIGTFLFGDPMAATPMGKGGGTPTIRTILSSRDIIGVSNAPVSTTDWLKRGDWFQIGNGLDARLYKVVGSNNVNSNSIGDTGSIFFFPKLRLSPVAGDPIIINNPKGLFRRTSGTYQYQQIGCNYSISFDCEEVI